MRLRAALLLATLPMALAAPAAAGPTWGAATLSLFKPHQGGFQWLKRDPVSGAHRAIATFPKTELPEVAWSPDRKRGIVWYAEEPPRLWEVTIADGRKRALPVPPRGALKDAGYDAQGRAIALTLETQEPRSDAKGTYLLHAGKRYDVPEHQEGIPALAHAFRFEGGAWKPAETAFTTTGWDYAQVETALELSQALAPRTTSLHERHPEGDTVQDPALLARLNALAPDLIDPEGQWLTLKTTAGPVYLYEDYIEFLWATNLLAHGDPARPRRVPDMVLPAALRSWHRSDARELRLTAVSHRDRYVLVTHGGDGGHPRLFDVKAGRTVYASSEDLSVVFWPR